MTHRGLLGFLGDSAPVLWFGQTLSPGGKQTGVYVDTVLMLRYSPDATTADTLGRFPGGQWFVWTAGDRAALLPLPFGWTMHGTVRDGTIYVGTGEHYEISQLNESGELERVTRLAFAASSVSRRDRREDQARRLSEGRGAPYTEDMVDAIPYPSKKPAYSSMLVDRSGNLWVRSWPDSPASPGRWIILDPAGSPVGWLNTPAQGGILDIGDDLVGVWRDESGVEALRLYGIGR